MTTQRLAVTLLLIAELLVPGMTLVQPAALELSAAADRAGVAIDSANDSPPVGTGVQSIETALAVQVAAGHGGNTWQQQYSCSMPCTRLLDEQAGESPWADAQSPYMTTSWFSQAMWFFGGQHGWLAGSFYLRAQNGGQTWEPWQHNREIWSFVRFMSPSTGLAVGPADAPPAPPLLALLRTDDGGATWNALSLLPAGANAVWANVNGTRLWAVGAGGSIALIEGAKMKTHTRVTAGCVVTASFAATVLVSFSLMRPLTGLALPASQPVGELPPCRHR